MHVLYDFSEVSMKLEQKFQERSKRNKDNKSKSTMCHYAGTKSFARRRAEKRVRNIKATFYINVFITHANY